MAPDPLSPDNLLALAHDHHDPESRARLADQIGTLLLTTGGDRAGHAAAILTSLLPRLEERVRAHLAKRLAPSAATPPAIVRSLAEDVIRVAYPILLDSPVLTEKDLIDIAALRGRDHRLAIAQRAQISETVTAALVAHGPEDVVERALRNPSARFSEKTFRTVADLARRIETLQVPLGHRADLPAALAQEILAFVSDEVKAEIRRRLQPYAPRDAILDASLKNQISAALECRRPVDGPLLLAVLRGGAASFLDPLIAQAIGAPIGQVRDALAQAPHRLLPCVAVLLGLSPSQMSHLWLHFRQARPAIGEEGISVSSVLATYGALTQHQAEIELRNLLSASAKRCRA